MNKIVKRIGVGIAVLLGIVVVAGIALSITGNAKASGALDIRGEAVALPSDEVALARGEHLIKTSCTSCHGADLAGTFFMDDPAIATVYASNITGLADTHTDEEIVRAIRHGLAQDGRPLIIMPSESFIYFSEEDMGAMVAYLKTVPRVGEAHPLPEMGPMGRVLLGAGPLDNLFPAIYMDHSISFPEMPEVGASVAYGEYVARFCYACHGTDLAGGQPPDPASPAGPNLTMGGEMQGWTEEDFLTAMRTGVTPTGRQLDPAFMPYDSFGKFDDEELQGLWLYLQTLSIQNES